MESQLDAIANADAPQEYIGEDNMDIAPYMRSGWRPGSKVFVNISDQYDDPEKAAIMLGISDWSDVNDVDYELIGDSDRPILRHEDSDTGVLTIRPGTDAELINPKTGIIADAMTINLNSPNWLKESTILFNYDLNPAILAPTARFEESHNNFFGDCLQCRGGFFDMHTTTRNSYGLTWVESFAYFWNKLYFRTFPNSLGEPLVKP